MSFFMHETALVDDGAQIGSDTKIWHWVHICAGAVIGSNCVLGQNVFVGNKVVIGNNVKIQNHVSVYDNVILEDDVFCGPGMVFTNVYNPRSFINRKTEFKNTHIKRGVTLGANCTIVCGITIGEYAFVGAGAVVNKEVPPFALMLGVPGKQAGWMSRFGERIRLPLSGAGEYTCPNTGDVYILQGNKVGLKA
jgi:UDP-2-acetamido-3-amino-2,3-dideoxy-glucuronate N-acetyltransferase